MIKKLQWKCYLLSIILFIITIGWGLLLYQGKPDIPTSASAAKEDLIRFHVLANSDSTDDQQLKLKVRDALIAYLEPHFEHITTKTEAMQIVLEHKDKLITVAEQVIAVSGADYPVDIQVGMFDFPIKSYGNLVLPAGKYEAVRVLIGQASGKNWWCVLFPPLCFVDITNATATPLQGSVNNNDQQAVQIEFKSKIAELWRESQK